MKGRGSIALLLIDGVLSLPQISMIGAGLSLLFVLAHWGIGKAYLRGLSASGLAATWR